MSLILFVTISDVPLKCLYLYISQRYTTLYSFKLIRSTAFTIYFYIKQSLPGSTRDALLIKGCAFTMLQSTNILKFTSVSQ